MKVCRNFPIILLLIVSFIFLGCKSVHQEIEKTPPIKNGLSNSELSYYNDSFDLFNEDLWELSGYFWNKQQMENMILGDVKVRNGELILATKKGGFSRAGIGTKYRFKGDFDIQIDCKMNFIEGSINIAQQLDFVIVEQSDKEIEDRNFVAYGILKPPQKHKKWLRAGYSRNGKWNSVKSMEVADFDGTLRLQKKGSKIFALYKKNKSNKWITLCKFTYSPDDNVISISIKNFYPNWTSIKAKASFSAIIDNFIINYADAIVESEI